MRRFNKGRTALVVVICGLACAIMASAVLSCSPAAKSLDKDSLIVYAKAKDLYEKGDFAAAFSALEQEKGAARFPPALVLKGKAPNRFQAA